MVAKGWLKEIQLFLVQNLDTFNSIVEDDG